MTGHHHPLVLGGIKREKHNMPSTLCHSLIQAKDPVNVRTFQERIYRLEDENEDVTISVSQEKIMVANTVSHEG